MKNATLTVLSQNFNELLISESFFPGVTVPPALQMCDMYAWCKHWVINGEGGGSFLWKLFCLCCYLLLFISRQGPEPVYEATPQAKAGRLKLTRSVHDKANVMPYHIIRDTTFLFLPEQNSFPD